MPILGALIYVVGLAATVWVTRTPDIPLQEQFQGITWLAMAIGAVWALGVAFFAESKFWAAVSVGVVGTSTYAAYARYAVVPDAWIPYVVPACLTLAVVSLGALAAIVTFEATWAVRPKPIRKLLTSASLLCASGFAAYAAIRYFGLPPVTFQQKGERAALLAGGSGAGLLVVLALYWPVRWLAKTTGLFMRTWFWASAAATVVLANTVFDLGAIWTGVLNGAAAVLLGVIAALLFFKQAKDTYAQAETDDERWKTVTFAPLGSVMVIGLGGVLLVVGKEVPAALSAALTVLASVCFAAAGGLMLLSGWLATLVVAEGTSEVEILRNPDRASQTP